MKDVQNMNEDTTWLAKHGGYAKDMTLRDYFAAKAMQGLTLRLASKEGLIVFDDAVAESAYAMADEMLKAREK